MNEFNIKIDNFSNQAMEDDSSGEIIIILKDIIKSIKDHGVDNVDIYTLRDTNGDTIGKLITE